MNTIRSKVIQVIEQKKPRYITEQYLKKQWSDDVYQEFLNYTSFSYEPAMTERLFCAIHDIKHHDTCVFSGEPLTTGYLPKFDYDPWVYMSACSTSQYNSKVKGVWPPEGIYPIDYDKMFDYIERGPAKATMNIVCIYNMYQWIISKTNIDVTLVRSSTEAFYLIKNNIKNYPLCSCGTPLTYKEKGRYSQFCSKKCAGNSDRTKNKRKQTCKDKYGAEVTFKSEEIKEKIKQTNTIKYGVDNPFKSKDIQEQIKQTNQEKYGVEYPQQNPKIRARTADTNRIRYGVDNPAKNKVIKDKTRATNISKYGAASPLQNPNILQKRNENNLVKYGTPFSVIIKKFVKKLKIHLDKLDIIQ